MEKIYSKIEPDLLLHIIHRFSEFDEMDSFRTEIIEPDNFIQCAALNMDKGKTFRPHKHIYKKRTYEKQIAQESWVVIKGSVQCLFYDIDNQLIATPILKEGDASFSLAGGHSYLILDNGSKIYETKTGPYEGQKYDKEFID